MVTETTQTEQAVQDEEYIINTEEYQAREKAIQKLTDRITMIAEELGEFGIRSIKLELTEDGYCDLVEFQ